jgi:hypothetical protein
MAFLFKSKKNQQGSGLPPATRNIHTSEGAPSGTPAPLNGPKEREHTPTPPGSYNNSLNSLSSFNGPDQQRVRQRAESESHVSDRVFIPVTLDSILLLWK